MSLRIGSARGIGAAFVSIVLICGCGAATVQRLDGATRAQPGRTDEKQLWEQAAKYDAAVVASGLLVREDTLTSYANAVARRVLAASGAAPDAVRVHVLRNPLVNASALPNGSIYVHSGMLARLENEAQLAALLGHEIEHYLGRHALRQQRSRVQTESLMLLAGALFVTIGAPAQGLLDSSGPFIDAQVRGYAHDLERQSDAASFRAMTAAGYDCAQIPRMFEIFAAMENEAGITEPYYYSDHPATLERLEDAKKMVAARPAGGDVGAEAYDRGVAGALLVNAAEDARLRRFDLAQAAVERYLRVRPEDAEPYFVLGEVLRRKAGGSGADIERTAAAYRRAIELDESMAQAHRELGLLYRSQGRTAEARARLKRYLELSPQAADRPIIETYMQ